MTLNQTAPAYQIDDLRGQVEKHLAALIAAKELAARLGISRSHLHNLVKAGKFPAPAIKDGARFTRWRVKDISTWLENPQGWADRNSAGSEVAA